MNITAQAEVRLLTTVARLQLQQRRIAAALLELETRYCRQEPYLSLGRYIHVTALKSQAHSRFGDCLGKFTHTLSLHLRL
jgi:S-adenosylmethionine-dependent methyltransferase